MGAHDANREPSRNSRHSFGIEWRSPRPFERVGCPPFHAIGDPITATADRQPELLTRSMRNGVLECGDSSPLLLAATRRGASTDDESAVERAGASSRTSKPAILHAQAVGAGGRWKTSGRQPKGRVAPPFLIPGEKSGLGPRLQQKGLRSPKVPSL